MTSLWDGDHSINVDLPLGSDFYIPTNNRPFACCSAYIIEIYNLLGWPAVDIAGHFHRFGSPLKFLFDIWSGIFFYQMVVHETNLRKTYWVMLFRDPRGVSDDVILGHVRRDTCDMLPVFPGIRLILNRCLRLKPEKGPQMIIVPYSRINTALGVATQCNARTKTIRSLVAACL